MFIPQKSNIICQIESHEQQQCFAICIAESCQKKGLLCFKCLLQYHQPHLNYCIPLNDFNKLMTDNANAITLQCLGNEPTYDITKEQKDKIDKTYNQINILKKELVQSLENYMTQQLDNLKATYDRLCQCTYMTVLRDNLNQLKQTDKLSYREMSSLFEFFKPFIQKDQHSQNFNFVCSLPNYKVQSAQIAEHIDRVIDSTQSSLFELKQIINKIQSICTDLANLAKTDIDQTQVSLNNKSSSIHPYQPQSQPAVEQGKNVLLPLLQYQLMSQQQQNQQNQQNQYNSQQQQQMISQEQNGQQNQFPISQQQQQQENPPSSEQQTIPKKKSCKKIVLSSVQSEKRLELRSLEHFCDAIEISYLNVWGLSFRVMQDDVSFSSFSHFPVYIYSNSYCQSLDQAELQVYIIEGQKIARGKKIHQQKVILNKTTLNSLDDDYTQTFNFEKLIPLKRGQIYTLAIANVTQPQFEDSAQRLFISFGDVLVDNKQKVSLINENGEINVGVEYLNADYQEIEGFLDNESFQSSQLIFDNRINDKESDQKNEAKVKERINNLVSDYFISDLGFQLAVSESSDLYQSKLDTKKTPISQSIVQSKSNTYQLEYSTPRVSNQNYKSNSSFEQSNSSSKVQKSELEHSSNAQKSDKKQQSGLNERFVLSSEQREQKNQIQIIQTKTTNIINNTYLDGSQYKNESKYSRSNVKEDKQVSNNKNENAQVQQLNDEEIKELLAIDFSQELDSNEKKNSEQNYQNQDTSQNNLVNNLQHCNFKPFYQEKRQRWNNNSFYQMKRQGDNQIYNNSKYMINRNDHHYNRNQYIQKGERNDNSNFSYIDNDYQELNKMEFDYQLSKKIKKY